MTTSPQPIRVQMAMDLFVEDEEAMREAALQRLRDAWSGDEDFPYAEASDVPFDQVVNSLVADALPLELPGARRGQLSVESEQTDDDDDDDDDDDNGDREKSDDRDADSDDHDESDDDPVDKQS